MDILEYCEQVADTIHTLEKDAKKALAEENTESYKALMLEKANTLASLEDEMKKMSFDSIDDKARLFVMLRLPSFAKSAKTAISLNSTWYMSQLLFDTDYQEGEANNFDLFIEELKNF